MNAAAFFIIKMELIINKSTRTLKQMNSYRRHSFVEKVLSNYNYQADSFDAFILATQEELKKTHNIKMSLKQVKNNFFLNFAKNVNLSIWEFLNLEDKRRIGDIKKLEIEQPEIQKFIEFNSQKIKEYADYVKSNSAQEKGESEDLIVIYAYIAKSYGWTFEYIEEMDELQLLKAVEQAILNDKKENINTINAQALAGAYASGNKKAKTQIDNLSQKLQTEINLKKIAKTNPKFELKNELTREQLQKIMEADNGRRS